MRNGVRDAGEPYLNGWTVRLLDGPYPELATQVTADLDLDDSGTIDPETESGWYSFTGLVPGSYWVIEVVPGLAITPHSRRPPVVMISTAGAAVASLVFKARLRTSSATRNAIRPRRRSANREDI